MEFFLPFWLTLQLAVIVSFLLLVLCLPLAYWLSGCGGRWKRLWQSVFSMPLVLPPTVLGFYLLLLFSPEGFLGGWLERVFGVSLLFTFWGLVLGSVVYSLPFMFQPLLSGFESIPPCLWEASYTLGRGRWWTFWGVIWPLMRPYIWRGLALSFAHTVGEFGVVWMIGGGIPGRTRVVSIAIYDEVQALNYGLAHMYSGVLLVFSFLLLWLVYTFVPEGGR